MGSRVRKLTISRNEDNVVQVSGMAGSGKTTYLLGVAYRMSYHNKNVLWLNANYENQPDDHTTVIDCIHINQLEAILQESKIADVIILDDLHLVQTGPRLGVDVLMLFAKNIPEGQERFYSLQSRM
jgi:ABC-type cobalamin/Fe3+-siderophores transport system ATPase subunit